MKRNILKLLITNILILTNLAAMQDPEKTPSTVTDLKFLTLINLANMLEENPLCLEKLNLDKLNIKQKESLENMIQELKTQKELSSNGYKSIDQIYIKQDIKNAYKKLPKWAQYGLDTIVCCMIQPHNTLSPLAQIEELFINSIINCDYETVEKLINNYITQGLNLNAKHKAKIGAKFTYQINFNQEEVHINSLTAAAISGNLKIFNLIIYTAKEIYKNNIKQFINAVDCHNNTALMHSLLIMIDNKIINMEKNKSGYNDLVYHINNLLYSENENQRIEIIKVLLELGTDITIQNDNLDTAITLAKKLDNPKINNLFNI